jgi:sugar lactone lactonase YvrE
MNSTRRAIPRVPGMVAYGLRDSIRWLGLSGDAGGRRRVRTRRRVENRLMATVESLERVVLLSNFSVTNTNNAGVGSLREAIIASNAAPGQTNTITFNITGSGVHTISPLSALPAITTSVVIDATTIAGYTSNPLIELNGSSAGMGSDGLVIAANATGTVIKGLDIHNFSGVGVEVFANNAVLSANDIGTGVFGGAAYPNLGGGVDVRGSNNTIGGVNVLKADGSINAFKGNVISGNNGEGLAIEGNGNLVEGNLIGVNASGNDAVANTANGLVVIGSSNTIGGTTPGAGNVLSGNTGAGLTINATVAPPVTPYSTSADGLTLTQAGINQGFSLASFAKNFYVLNNVGPAGIAFPASGGVLVDDGWGYLYKFPTDQNGQNAGSVSRITYGTNLIGMAEVNGRNYVVERTTGSVLQVDDAGNKIRTIVSGINWPGGMIAVTTPGPLYGHLLVSTDLGLAVYDVDPVAGTRTLLVNLDHGADGMAFDSVGNTLYVVENVYGVVGYDLTTKQKVFDSGQFSSSEGMPDGISIGTGNLRYNLLINTNSGNLIQIYTPAPKNHIMIAHLGSRGDLTAIDPYNGTLLISQSSSVERLIPPPRAGFDGGPSGTATNNLVQGNLLGVGLDHRTLIPNGDGIDLNAGASGNTIGGTDAGQGNISAGNKVYGVTAVDPSTSNNSILGNGIGTDLSGNLVAGNGVSGVWFGRGASDNTTRQNLIANNAHNGVTVLWGISVGNSIEANSIYNNGGIGIDLNYDGVTRNGTQTPPGPNNWQPYPVLTAAYANTSSTIVAGTATGTPGAVVTIDFYANDKADPSGYGQGKTYLGSITATAGATFQATLPTPTSSGQYISATETSASGDTSEFSADLAVSTRVPGSVSVSSELPVSVYGQSVRFAAKVAGIPAPTGTIQFQLDGVNFGQAVAIDSSTGQAYSPTTTRLPAGNHTISALYSGDSNYPSASASTNQTVDKAALTIKADPKTMPFGGPVPPLTYTISGFVNGDTSAVIRGLPVLTTQATAGSPVAGSPYPITVDVSRLSASNYTFNWVYNLLNVVPAGSVTTLALVGSALPSQATTFTATVNFAGGPVTEGNVTFSDGGVLLGTVPLNNGSASFSAILTPGQHAIRAAYSGGPDVTASSSPPLPVSIPVTLTGDVTSHVIVQLAPPVRAKKGKTYSETVTITPIPGQVIKGPLSLIVKGLSRSVRLMNASGTTHIFKKLKYPYLQVPVGGTGLLTGSTGPRPLVFGSRPNNFKFQVWAGPAAP